MIIKLINLTNKYMLQWFLTKNKISYLRIKKKMLGILTLKRKVVN